jgi:hypothetical protein
MVVRIDLFIIPASKKALPSSAYDSAMRVGVGGGANGEGMVPLSRSLKMPRQIRMAAA